MLTEAITTVYTHIQVCVWHPQFLANLNLKKIERRKYIDREDTIAGTIPKSITHHENETLTEIL